MLPLAHIATAMLMARAAKASTPSAVLGALAPDLIDKPPAWVMKVTPSGRYFGHSLPFGVLVTLASTRLLGRSVGLGFGLGYLAHLGGDIGGPMPWLMPFVRYDYPKDHHFQFRPTPAQLAAEGLGLGLILFLSLRRPKHES